MAVFNSIGFLVTSAVLLFVLMKKLGVTTLRSTIASICITLFVNIMFLKILRVPLLPESSDGRSLETEFGMKSAFQGLVLLFNFKVIVDIVLSSIYGLFVGAMPGLTATMAAALLIPFTFFMDPVPALVSVVTMSAMAIFAGDIPAAVIPHPGTPSSAAYTQDSFELTKQGKAELVLGEEAFFVPRNFAGGSHPHDVCPTWRNSR